MQFMNGSNRFLLFSVLLSSIKKKERKKETRKKSKKKEKEGKKEKKKIKFMPYPVGYLQSLCNLKGDTVWWD